MDRDRLLIVVAGVFVGLAVLLAVAALAVQPFLLVLALPFAGVAYLLWYRATGRVEARARREAARGRRPGERARTRRTDRARRDGPRSADGPTRAEARRILGFDPDATPSEAEVRSAYRDRVKEVHPDAETGDEEAFKRVNRAYERLTE